MQPAVLSLLILEVQIHTPLVVIDVHHIMGSRQHKEGLGLEFY